MSPGRGVHGDEVSDISESDSGGPAAPTPPRVMVVLLLLLLPLLLPIMLSQNLWFEPALFPSILFICCGKSILSMLLQYAPSHASYLL